MTVDTDGIRSLVRARDLGTLSSLVRTMPPSRVVHDLEALPIEDATVVFRLLDKELAVEVFDDLGTATQADLVSRLGHAPLTEVFAALDPDEQARLLDELPARVATRLVDSFTGHELDATMELLGYPHGSVGRQMSPVAVHARHDETVSQVLDRLARHTGDTDVVTMVPVIGSPSSPRTDSCWASSTPWTCCAAPAMRRSSR